MSLQYVQKDDTKILIGLGFMAIVVLMVLVTWVSVNSLHDVNSNMSGLIENTDQKTTVAYRMRDVIRLRSNTVRNLIQSEDFQERYELFDEFIDHTDNYEHTRGELIAQGANEREEKILEHIDAAYVRVNEAIEDADNSMYATSQDNVALEGILSDLQLRELVLLNHLNGLVQLEKTIASEELALNQQMYTQTRRVLICIVLAAFILSLIISGIVISRVAAANKRISHLANHDDLTGLHNRRSFEQHLKYTIDIAERSPNSHGLLYIDLDHFKIVNDTCGHNAGDQLLIQLTQLMNNRLRRGDLFARLGGDEFAIIAQGKSFHDIQTLAEELRQIVCDFRYQYESQKFSVSLSVGVTPIDGQVESLERVLADVDSACYVAKKSGRNRVHVTQENDADVVQYRNNVAGVQSVRKALAEDRLALFYQPIFKVGSKDASEMSHCEILLRIQSETGEFYSPSGMIPIAEKYNIMTEIDQWVFNHVIEWLIETQKTHTIPRLLINLSGHSFAEADFIELIVSRLEGVDVDPSCIAFEISESALTSNFDNVVEFTNKIRGLGCELALDDFGAGFSNFTHLKNLPFDYLKIDGGLIKNIATSDLDKNMVSAINQMGHTVGAKTIAEFVEDEAALNCLRELNVDYAQGYGLSMPTPIEQLTAELTLNGGDADSDSSNPLTDSDQHSDSMQSGEFKKAS